MDMSLDYIIKNKKVAVAPSKRLAVKKPPLRETLNRPAFKEAARITDARMKIIQKNRAKIRDAREKLIEITRNNGDVRKKLSQKQDLIVWKAPYKASSFKYSRLGGGDVGGKLAADAGGLNHLTPPSPPNGSSSSYGGLSKSLSSSSSSSSGYRIFVSHLHPSVTQSDIKELFEDIGELYDSRIVRPGVAEIIYKSLAHAEKAVDTYHNRQLDGQPMKCILVNPRALNKPTAPAVRTSSSHSSNKTPLEIDIYALHKVIFGVK
ncbi:uncharacterized protein LOC133338184 [Musca vetustissima]|uniref:uncharacterized protein LOC133338184 n=1 Tax=Musca vetustissima TaxID=27455 RepID=UPI002AB64046|nr:uncharacterized protein LOC133338184 [Musca vetustissima]